MYALSTTRYGSKMSCMPNQKTAKGIDFAIFVGLFLFAGYTAVKFKNASNALKIESGVAVCVALAIAKVDKNAAHPPKRSKLLKEARKVVLFTSITANPATDGHIAMVDTARQHFDRQFVTVKEINIAIAPQSYVAKKESDREKSGSEPKPQRSYEERKKTVIDKIAEHEAENGMLEECPGITRFFDGRDLRHSEIYKELESQHPDATVVWVCGTDMCHKYGKNWDQHGMKHVAVVSRGRGDLETLIAYNHIDGAVDAFTDLDHQPYVTSEMREDFSRILLVNAHPDYADVSSTQVNAALSLTLNDDHNRHVAHDRRVAVADPEKANEERRTQ